MRKIREVLHLRYELKLSHQQIGRSCAIGICTVYNYLKRAEAAGVGWPLGEEWDEARLNSALFRAPNPATEQRPSTRTPPDFAEIHNQLHGRVTLQLLWRDVKPKDALYRDTHRTSGR